MVKSFLVLSLLVQSVSPFLYPATVARRRRPTRIFEQPTVPTQLESSFWQSHVSTHPDAAAALTKLLGNLNLPDKPPDLAFLFVTRFHADRFATIVEQAAAQLTPSCRLVSVVGGGVIGENIELDEPSKPSMSLLAGFSLPLDSVELFDFNELAKPPPPVGSQYWNKLSGDGSSSSSFLLFADPWSPVENVTAALGNDAVIAGGISVATGVGPTVAIDDKPLPQGSLVGVCFKNLLKLEVVVAQGCRPTGPPFIITAAEGSCILELDSEPALDVLENFVSSIEDPEEQTSISSGLVCGIQANNEDGDFLIRQILGFVPSKGGIAVAGSVHTGDQFQFHVRDKNAAKEDLELMMKRARTERTVFGDRGKLVAALQISCVARGRSLFKDPNVDLSQTKLLLDEGGPVAGFYANGEIGPVGIAGFSSTTEESGSHIHGFTTVMAYLCDMRSTSNDKKGTQTPASLVDEPADAWG